MNTGVMRDRFQKIRNRLPPMEEKHFTAIKIFIGLTVTLIYAGYSDKNSKVPKFFIYPSLFLIFFFIAKRNRNLLLLAMAVGFISAYFIVTKAMPDNTQKGIIPEIAMDATVILWGGLLLFTI